MNKVAFCVLALALVASSAAAQFSCTNARPADYTGSTSVLGWGSNWKKQLGPQRVTTDTINRPTPLAVASIDAPVYTAVSGGLMHTAVVESKGKRVYISGTGADGQLGGGPQSQKDEVAEFGAIARIVGDDGLPAALNFPLFDAAAGWYHTCVLATVNNKGKAYCTGKNLKGQLGASNITTRVSLLVAVEGATSAFADANLVKIVSGPDHVLALDAAGGLWAWGNGARGEIGNGAKVVQKKAVAVALPVANVKVAAIDCGFRFCLARTEGNDLYGWGLNDQNQISSSNTAQFETPQLIASGVTDMAAGGSHVLYVSGNRVYSYGAGTMGQTGQARSIPDGLNSDWKITVPTLVPDLAGVAVHRIAAGMKHSVVQDTCGNVYTFGSDAMNQLGHDNSIGESQSFRILKPRVVAGVAARNVQPVRVFAGAYNTYLISYDKPARR